jgi:hypothetical protein
MKKPWLALLSNLLLPGAGPAYLGMWGWAVSAAAPNALGALSAGLAAGSGGLAMSLATCRNAQQKAPSVEHSSAAPAEAVVPGANRPANQCPACGTVQQRPTSFCTECGPAMAGGA